MSIHTIGDSHSNGGWSNNIRKHEIGPLLCYSFGKEKLDRCDIRHYEICKGDTIVFCLGEIDCRCHIHKHITDTITYKDIITVIVDNYFEAIELNVTTSQLNLKNVCVYNVVPPIKKEGMWENQSFPFLGTDEERKTYVLYFNERLKQKCVEYGYVFFDIYDHYVDANGFLKKELSDGNVHICDGRYISEFITNHNLQ